MPRSKRKAADSQDPIILHPQYHPHQQQGFDPRCFSIKGKIKTTELIKPITFNQKAYVDSIRKNILTLVHGVPGSGKTSLALYQAVQLLNQESSTIEKIFYLRSNIGMSEEPSLGAIPGDLIQKTLVLAYPVLDSLINFMPETQAKFLLESGRIEVLPMSMIRGRSFKNAFVIADETQNMSPHMMKTLITRIGEGTKMVVSGDQAQKDSKASVKCGLSDAVNRLQNLDGVGIIQMNREDIVRHPIVGHFLERYED